MSPIIHWFRRDLRLSDNTALSAAARDSGSPVIPVFILDDRLLKGRFVGAARVRFMLESLRALDAALRERGSALIFRHGDPQHELLDLLKVSGAAGVYWNRDYSPYAIERDTKIKQALKDEGYTARSFKDAVIFEMDEVVKDDGTPYTVFTPYARRWQQRRAETGIYITDIPDLHRQRSTLPTAQPIPELHDLGLHTDQQAIPGGEQHGQQLLSDFVDLRRNHAIADYEQERNHPGLPSTSRLSAHLRLGTVSPRVCMNAALETEQRAGNPAAAAGAQSWGNELVWREFYVQILYHFPHVLRGTFRREYDALQWENDTDLFTAWCAGRTGYPIVDAAMRQLNTEAWMHNRSRMIVASFLTKDLLIDWRWGEQYFMRQLVDGDPAANNGGWQWAAGTGTDAQPYFRIFNPVSQGQKFDSDGDYVRRYVPELVRVPNRYIHEPWQMSADVERTAGVRIGTDYPHPIVDHKAQRERALELYGSLKK